MVERYLTDALNLIQQHAFYAGRVDWPAVRAEAGRRTPTPPPRPGPTTPSAGCSKLGDRHSLLLTPEQASELKASGAAGRSFGMVALFHLTEGIGVDRTGATYQDRIQPDRPVATDWTRHGSPADPVLQAATRWLEGR
jgi:hypothetical protein